MNDEQTLDYGHVIGHRPNFRVRITKPGSGQEVVFNASSPIVEGRSATYDQYSILHLPTDIFAYHNTTARSFGITGKLVSRNKSEALSNAAYLNNVRAWLLPEFGTTGATPPILKIYGYHSINIDGRPVLLKDYSWTFVDDVDYIFFDGSQQEAMMLEDDLDGATVADVAEPMPVIGILSMTFVEAYSPAQVTMGDWRMKFDRKPLAPLNTTSPTNSTTSAAAPATVATSSPSVTDKTVPAATSTPLDPLIATAKQQAASGTFTLPGSTTPTSLADLTAATNATKAAVTTASTFGRAAPPVQAVTTDIAANIGIVPKTS